MTIIDIKKSGFPKVEKTYNVESLTELFEAIDDALKINPLIELIKVRRSEIIDVQKWKNKYGFDFFNYTDKREIKFRGFTKWVYFKNDMPVFFDDSCSGTDTQPHTATFKSLEYDTLEFDRCEKIRF